MNINKIKKLCKVRSNSLLIYLDKGTQITWVESPGLELTEKGKKVLFNETFIGFTKKQLPVFKYDLNEVLLVRSYTRDYIYVPSEKAVGNNKRFLHPQGIKEIYKKKTIEASSNV